MDCKIADFILARLFPKPRRPQQNIQSKEIDFG